MRQNNFILYLIVILLVFGISSCKDDTIDDEKKPNPTDTTAKEEPLFNPSSELPFVNLPNDNILTKEGVDLGRHLFYDKLLSEDNTLACASCHKQELGFTDNGLQFSIGTRKLPGNRNAMPLFNLVWFDSLFWDSRAKTIRELVLLPIQNPLELNTTPEAVVDKLNQSSFYKNKFKAAFNTENITVKLMAKAMEQFLITLVSDNSKFDKKNRGEAVFTAQEQRGFEIMSQKGCFNCHSTSLFTDNISHNTGLDLNFTDLGLGAITKKYSEEGKFKTPSLRNVEVTGPYMHDGRFKTLEEVIKFYDEDVEIDSRNISKDFMSQGLRNRLSASDKLAIIAFLKTLTDQKYLTNPRFKSPF